MGVYAYVMCKCYTILYTGLEHLQISVSSGVLEPIPWSYQGMIVWPFSVGLLYLFGNKLAVLITVLMVLRFYCYAKVLYFLFSYLAACLPLIFSQSNCSGEITPSSTTLYQA